MNRADNDHIIINGIGNVINGLLRETIESIGGIDLRYFNDESVTNDITNNDHVYIEYKNFCPTIKVIGHAAVGATGDALFDADGNPIASESSSLGDGIKDFIAMKEIGMHYRAQCSDESLNGKDMGDAHGHKTFGPGLLMLPGGSWGTGYIDSKYTKLTNEQAWQMFDANLVRMEQEAAKHITVWNQLNDGQKACLISITFNHGNCYDNGLGNKINSNPNDPTIPDFIKNYCVGKAGSKYEKGLRRRREQEALLWSTGKANIGGVLVDVGSVSFGGSSGISGGIDHIELDTINVEYDPNVKVKTDTKTNLEYSDESVVQSIYNHIKIGDITLGDDYDGLPVPTGPCPFRGVSRADKFKMLGLSGNITDPLYVKTHGLLCDCNTPWGVFQFNKYAAEDFLAICREIKSLGWYVGAIGNTYRSVNSVSSGISRHCLGIALDLAPGAAGNPWFDVHIDPNNSKGWRDWQPGEQPVWKMKKCPYHGGYNPTKCIWSWDHPVVKIFLAHGWGWGGSYGDVMHFSVDDGH